MFLSTIQKEWLMIACLCLAIISSAFNAPTSSTIMLAGAIIWSHIARN